MIFANSVGVEMKKILLRKKYYTLLFGELVIAGLIVFFTSSFEIVFLGFTFDLPGVPYLILNGLMVLVLPLMIFMLCADVFTNEIETGTLKAVLLRPISRFTVFTSKFFAIVLYVYLHLIAVCTVVLVIRTMQGSRVDLFAILAAYSIAILPMTAFVAFSTLISLMVKNSSLAMYISMILYFVMQGVTVISATIGAMFFTSHLSVHRMILSENPPAALTNTLLLLFSTIVFLSVLAFFLFDRKEL